MLISLRVGRVKDQLSFARRICGPGSTEVRIVCAAVLPSSVPKKISHVGYSMVYHEKALHNYFIPCHRKDIAPHNQYNARWECAG